MESSSTASSPKFNAHNWKWLYKWSEIIALVDQHAVQNLQTDNNTGTYSLFKCTKSYLNQTKLLTAQQLK